MSDVLFEKPTYEPEAKKHISVAIAQSAARAKDRTCLVCEDRRMSWAEFDRQVNKVANGLLAMGLQPNEKVAILASTSIEYVVSFIGIVRAGGCTVPLSTMASAAALERMMVDSRAKMFFMSQSMRDLAAPFIDRLDGLVDGGRIAYDFDAQGWAGFDAWVADQAETNPGTETGIAEDFNIIYSSGTTGVPKGITHSNGMRSNQMVGLHGYGFDDASVTVLSTPLYSNTTLVTLLPTLCFGGQTVLMKKFNVDGFLGLCQTERATHTMLVPVQYQRIMKHPTFGDYDLSSMRCKLSTSAPLRASLKRDIVARFPGMMVEIYGLTEGGVTTILSCTEFPDKLASVGRPGAGVELKIIDEKGVEVSAGAIGEIAGRSANMMSGYFNRPDLTGDMLWDDPDGNTFFKTGDMGRLDEDGFLFLSDRKKDMIISGGLNIYANDLEVELLKHDAVSDVAVIGIPSEQWGETPLGLVVVTDTCTDGPDDILTWANGRLGKSQRLARIEIRTSLPRSSIGKILKRELREPYWKNES